MYCRFVLTKHTNYVYWHWVLAIQLRLTFQFTSAMRISTVARLLCPYTHTHCESCRTSDNPLHSQNVYVAVDLRA